MQIAPFLDKTKSVKLANFIYDVASVLPEEADHLRPAILAWIFEEKVKKSQLDAIFEYTKKYAKNTESMTEAALIEHCGVGVVTTPEEIKETIAATLTENKSQLDEKRYSMVSQLHAILREKLKWADRGLVSTELNTQLAALLGPKGANEGKKVAKKEEEKEFKFPDPKENIQIRKELLEEHLKKTGGKVVTRFPPEPNGYLHIGHAKAINMNFGFANKKDGICYLRFDDTNPEAECQEYIDSIIDNVHWLGNEPYRITYASDYFEELLELGVQLIKMDKAFVCHQKPEDYRNENNPTAKMSPWRNRPIEESLKLFEDMRNGKFKEGEAAVRMKMNFESPNPCMWDLVAFRIKYHPHPRTGNKYCVYPTYDFTHCINDSLENITHSLCTLEYVVRQESYYWLVDTLGLYRPFVWEYGRLFISHTVLSKRRLIRLVNDGHVRGWDDPRMPTIVGFRRRGYTPSAINKFCEAIGVTRSDNVVVEYSRLEQCLRQDLERTARRAMAVMNPIKLVIENFETVEVERMNLPLSKEERLAGVKPETNKVLLTNTVYVEKTDFREEDDPEFFGLALKTKNNEPKWVRLKYGPVVAIKEVKRDENGEIVELVATKHENEKSQTKGTIHWVSFKEDGSEPDSAEIRMYSHLFKNEKPFKLKGDQWLSDINPDSLVVKRGFIDPTLVNTAAYTSFQFERVGYFTVDPDSTEGNMVFNLSVPLKESKDLKK